MIISRHHPRSREALFSVVGTALAGARVAVAQAGHFLLYEDKATGRVVPCVESELGAAQYDSLGREFGRFPRLSWRLAADLLTTLPLERRYLLVLVNDWQYVPSTGARESFYREHPQLPQVYRDDVRRDQLILTPGGPAGIEQEEPYFSERSLRNQFHRRLKKLAGSGQLPASLQVSRTATATTCSLEVMGRTQEVYCSNKSADCSGEVAQLLDDCYRLVNCDVFINFFPNVCEAFVDLGSQLPAKLFGTGISRIINISLPATQVDSEEDMLAEASVTVHAP